MAQMFLWKSAVFHLFRLYSVFTKLLVNWPLSRFFLERSSEALIPVSFQSLLFDRFGFPSLDNIRSVSLRVISQPFSISDMDLICLSKYKMPCYVFTLSTFTGLSHSSGDFEWLQVQQQQMGSLWAVILDYSRVLLTRSLAYVVAPHTCPLWNSTSSLLTRVAFRVYPVMDCTAWVTIQSTCAISSFRDFTLHSCSR